MEHIAAYKVNSSSIEAFIKWVDVKYPEFRWVDIIHNHLKHEEVINAIKEYNSLIAVFVKYDIDFPKGTVSYEIKLFDKLDGYDIIDWELNMSRHQKINKLMFGEN